MQPVIRFENVGKLYRLGTVGTGTLSHDLRRWWITSVMRKEDPYLKIGEANDRSTKGNSDYVYALKDINLEVQEGDVLGIIGKNGSGKSTLLKLLSRVTAPTTGKIFTKGRIASLLEVGTGFHPELTGRENIYMNGSILGMKKREINCKLDEIIDFSGCERYIDTPVKRYSSGMMVRLGFAVAAHLDPEILVVDEVLAVGDAEFQKKAIGKMQEINQGQGRTVLFVSHNMAAVKSICSKGLVLNNGIILNKGLASDMVDFYLYDNNKNNDLFKFNTKHRKNEDEKIRIIDFRIKSTSLHTGAPLDFYIEIINEHDKNVNVECAIAIKFNDFPITQFFSKDMGTQICLKRGTNIIHTNIPCNPLNEGVYSLNLWLGSNHQIIDWIQDCYSLKVDPGSIIPNNIIEFRGYPITIISHWNNMKL